MNAFLKQSTASQSRAIGPFLDDTDFKTAETGLTIANTDIKLVVNGGASANKNSGGGTHRVNGVYGVTFDATDSATLGEIEVSVVVSGALPVFHKFTVLPALVYDSLFLGTDNLQTDTVQIAGVTATNDDGVLQAGSTTTATLATTESATAQYLRGSIFRAVSGTGAKQWGFIVDYTTGRVATLHRPVLTAFDNTTRYTIEPGDDESVMVGLVNDAGATTTSVITTLTGHGNDFFNKSYFAFTSGALRGLWRKVLDYDSATGTFTFDAATQAWPSAPPNSAAFKLGGRGS